MPRKNKIIIRTGTGAPAAADFATGEPGFDSTAGALYIKNAAGQMSQITGGGGGATEVYEYASASNFPATGSAASLYIDKDRGKVFRWEAAAYVELGPVGGGLSWASVPSSSTASGSAGQIAYDSRFLYVAIGSNTWRRTAWQAWDTDANFSSVALLLHMDGSGQTFIDSSGTPKTITASGNATQTTDQSRFGGVSAYFDGSGDHIQTAINGVSSLSFSTVQHTVEFWFRTTSTQQYTCLFYRGRQVEAAYDYVLNINNSSPTSGNLALYSLGFGGAAMSENTGGLNDGQWHHVAIVRDASNVFRMYVDGSQRASRTFDMTESYSNSSDSVIRIGRDGALAGRDYAGYIDELRISRVCRYPGGVSFTPSTAAFPDA